MSQTDEMAEMEVDEVWQVHIYSPEKEQRVYASIEADQPELETAATHTGKTRELVLSEGGDIDTKGGNEPCAENPFVHQTGTDAQIHRTAIHRADVAIGYYLSHVETHGIGPAEDVHDELQEMIKEEQVDMPLDAYYEWVDEMNKSDRQLRLLDLGEHRVEEGGDWAAEPYLESCTWRSTNLSEQGENFAERVLNSNSIDLNPQHCYRNAQQVAIQHADNHLVEYVEGLALPKQCAQATRHAWVEYDGEVVELTWPWHFYDGDEAVYFGTEFDADTVEETFERRDGGSQLILDDSEVAQLKQTRAGA